jgi:uncharacterized protein YbjT (DUF2867 family)
MLALPTIYVDDANINYYTPYVGNAYIGGTMDTRSSKEPAKTGLQVIFGTGPVGCAAARHLLEEGLPVRMVNRSGRRPVGLFEDLAPDLLARLEFRAANVMDAAETRAAAAGATHIYHCVNVSYELWRRDLPAMVLPRWLRSRSEPVALDDVISALLSAARFPLQGSAWWDLPGPEALSGKELLLRVAAVMGRRPFLVPVPLVTPHLSFHWIRLVTRADPTIARELVEGLRTDLLAQRRGYWTASGLSPLLGLDEAARRALAAEGPLPPRGRLVEGLAGLMTRRLPPRRHRAG